MQIENESLRNRTVAVALLQIGENQVPVVGAFADDEVDSTYVRVAAPLKFDVLDHGVNFYPLVSHTDMIETKIPKSRVIAIGNPTPGLNSSYLDALQNILQKKSFVQDTHQDEHLLQEDRILN